MKHILCVGHDENATDSMQIESMSPPGALIDYYQSYSYEYSVKKSIILSGLAFSYQ